MFKNCIDAQNEFEKCWNNLAYTIIQLADVDINQTLSNYTLSKPIHFTKEMLWNMEKKKAWNPEKYIPYVIKEGTARSWDKHPCPTTNGEIFVRCSQQKLWLNPDEYENIYEEVYVNDQAQLITFLGAKSLPGCTEVPSPKQPLFHVQHGVSGSEERPINTWRIVHLTETKDIQLINHFKNFSSPGKLPGYIKEYIVKDLQIQLQQN
jgi:hypothetical protein